MHHFRIASRVFQLLDELLAAIERGCPIRRATLDVTEMVAGMVARWSHAEVGDGVVMNRCVSGIVDALPLRGAP